MILRAFKFNFIISGGGVDICSMLFCSATTRICRYRTERKSWANLLVMPFPLLSGSANQVNGCEKWSYSDFFQLDSHGNSPAMIVFFLEYTVKKWIWSWPEFLNLSHKSVRKSGWMPPWFPLFSNRFHTAWQCTATIKTDPRNFNWRRTRQSRLTRIIRKTTGYRVRFSESKEPKTLVFIDRFIQAAQG